MRWRRWVAVTALSWGLLGHLGALAETRVALLIGNSRYAAVAQLKNANADAEILRQALISAGFDAVDLVTDLDRAAFIGALRAFEDKASKADIAVIYYAGHGLEMGGENYLVPVDAHLKTERDVVDETVPLSRALASLEGARRLKLVILDACRNDPFAATMVRNKATRAVTRGLARVEPQDSDVMIAFASKAGTVASDGEGENSPFALSLSRRLIEPGVDIRLALGNVRDDVLAATARSQEPYAYGSVGGGTISLAPGLTHVGAGAQPIQSADPGGAAVEMKLWASAEAAGTADGYETYIRSFPEGVFAVLARTRLAQLRTPLQSALLRPAPLQPSVETPRTPTQVEDALALTPEERLAIEASLLKKGANPGELDGVIDDETRAGMRTWQYNQGYAATGFLDAVQLESLVGPREKVAISLGGVAQVLQALPSNPDPRLKQAATALSGRPLSYTVHEGHLYLAVPDPGGLSFQDAKELAEKAGGHLATIRSPAANDAIFRLIKSDPRFWWKDTGERFTSGPWIGYWQQPGSRNSRTGWIRADGSKLGYSNWDKRAGQPNEIDLGAGPGAAAFGGRSDGEPSAKWQDAVMMKQSAPGLIIEVP
jgi:hypothetical protein